MGDAERVKALEKLQGLVANLEQALVVDYKVIVHKLLQCFIHLLHHHALKDRHLQLNEARRDNQWCLAL